MEEFDATRRKLKVKTENHEVNVDFPSVDLAQWARREHEKAGEDEDKNYELTLQFLEKLGLHNEAAKEMEASDLKRLSSILMSEKDSKKN